jgi:L-lactate dehydrogenase complex protein LldE
MVRHCYPELAVDAAERHALTALASRIQELGEWLHHRGPLPWSPGFNGSMVLHQSCKARQLGVLAGAQEVLSQVKGLELLTISPYYTCCGFGGTFSWQQPELSRDIGEAYLNAITATGASGLVSLDSSCLLHLRGLDLPPARDLKFYHLAEILLMDG